MNRARTHWESVFARGMDAGWIVHLGSPVHPALPLTWDFARGARWNRTIDLSIISAAL